METLETLRKEIEEIKIRNKRVETDKAWETSNARKALIIALTYFTVVLFLIVSGATNPLLNAIIPSLGFFLSTLTVPAVKNWWIRNRNK